MYDWALGLFYKIKGVAKNPLFSSVTYYVIIALVLLYIGFYLIPKIMSGFGFLSQKEKLLKANAEQEYVITDLTNANKKLTLELQQCVISNYINKDGIAAFQAKAQENNKVVTDTIASKKETIKKITGTATPNVKIIYEDKTSTMPKSKVDEVSKVQIDSLWGEYEKVTTK